MGIGETEEVVWRNGQKRKWCRNNLQLLPATEKQRKGGAGRQVKALSAARILCPLAGVIKKMFVVHALHPCFGGWCSDLKKWYAYYGFPTNACSHSCALANIVIVMCSAPSDINSPSEGQ